MLFVCGCHKSASSSASIPDFWQTNFDARLSALEISASARQDKLDIAWDEWTNLQQTLNSAGRYSLVGNLHDGLFEIDHLTGRTWEYGRAGVGTTNIVSGWFELHNFAPALDLQPVK